MQDFQDGIVAGRFQGAPHAGLHRPEEKAHRAAPDEQGTQDP